ncbi:MAG TPA: hypothetical protein VFQ72_00150 [Candidatus Paceibacterota bacterium]|nr:hypothetical protein [Candidatus Paceibacterota bacterium]
MIFELTTGILMLASALTGSTSPATAATASQGISSDQPLSTVSTEAYVRDYFKDIPLLAEISRCESTFRQFDKDGKPIVGKVNKSDIGVMQINTYYHGESAAKLGFDLTTIDGNLGYARYLYGKYGSDPWSSSSKCWGTYEKPAKDLART